MSDLLMLIAAEAAHGAVEAAHAGAEHHAEPAIGGVFNATVIVSISMLLLIGIMLWKKVPALVAGMLDNRIAQIRAQLDEAASLRQEAEALRGEYQAKIAALDSETAAMRARAEQEAALMIAKAEEDAKALVARRQRMAEDRIAAAERSAVAEVRDTASRAAVAAARDIIADAHDSAADKPLVERAIADIARI
jgi:F-type H+-transporting ATPase subunit b